MDPTILDDPLQLQFAVGCNVIKNLSYDHKCFVLSFTVPPGVMISRPCRTSYHSSPSSAIPCFPRDSLHVFRHPLCDVTAVFGLPRPRFPLTFPWITHFTSSHPPSLIVCPKKESLRRTTNPRSCLVVLSSVRILLSVRCSVQLTRNIR